MDVMVSAVDRQFGPTLNALPALELLLSQRRHGERNTQRGGLIPVAVSQPSDAVHPNVRCHNLTACALPGHRVRPMVSTLDIARSTLPDVGGDPSVCVELHLIDRFGIGTGTAQGGHAPTVVIDELLRHLGPPRRIRRVV